MFLIPEPCRFLRTRFLESDLLNDQVSGRSFKLKLLDACRVQEVSVGLLSVKVGWSASRNKLQDGFIFGMFNRVERIRCWRVCSRVGADGCLASVDVPCNKSVLS